MGTFEDLTFGTQTNTDTPAATPDVSPDLTGTEEGIFGPVAPRVTTEKVPPKGEPVTRIDMYVDPETGDVIDVMSDGTEVVRRKGTIASDKAAALAAEKARKEANKVSAFNILQEEFAKNGMGSLVEGIRGLIVSETPESEFLMKLRALPKYQERFAANAKRITNGFAAIDEATYLDLEDQYQSLMQNYGLPPARYSRGEMGRQEGFEELISNNVDPVTLEERIQEGQKVLKSNKQILDAAKQFFPTLTDGDFLDYVLNPKNALTDIKRKVATAEIGGAQLGAGLKASAAGAEALVAGGATAAKYQQSASEIAQASIRGAQLAEMYKQSPYTQETAEQAILKVPGSVEATKETKKIKELEKASFAKTTGMAKGALDRERAGNL